MILPPRSCLDKDARFAHSIHGACQVEPGAGQVAAPGKALCSGGGPDGRVCHDEDMNEEMPSPPFPDPDSPVLQLIVRSAIEAMTTGEATAEEAILHAAVHGWYEGHIQGEDACPGCDFRGRLRKQTRKGWIDPHSN